MAQPPRRKQRGSTEDSPTAENFPGRRELIVVAKRQTGLRATKEGVASLTGVDVSPLADLLASEGIALLPLFGVREERLQAEAAEQAARTGAEVPDLSIYYRVEAPDERLDELAERLRELDAVDAAYVTPPTEPAQVRLNDMTARMEEPPVHTLDFTARQGYLGPAPTGIDAEYAWTWPGGRGAGVNIIDIEWGWRFTHEDLTQNQGGVVSGTNSSVLDSENHGTAVLGVFSGDHNTFGIRGISPDAHVSAVSLATHNTAQAIRIAADRLNSGDIILLEVHRQGPQGVGFPPQFGYIAVEWWPENFDAIRYAVSKGIIVVEAAGNGGQNLDDAVYNTNPGPPIGPFPASWRNPFNPANPSSGAIVVGAGMPSAGTHSRNADADFGDVYADRGRCFFSNFGARVDVQGWGYEVTSTGYGDLQGGSNRDEWYTDEFSGTSSASPIVVGALACLQGVLRAEGAAPLSATGARDLLRATGWPQQDGPGFTFTPNMTGTGYPQVHPARPHTERIGNRPDLRHLIVRALPPPPPPLRPCEMLRRMILNQNRVVAQLWEQWRRANSQAEREELEAQINVELTQLDGVLQDYQALGCSPLRRGTVNLFPS
jgi:hypothetical protein